ncbi:unnamed protein product, partial [Timema podura]|nr:unnamed protein product [Timema podura]
IAKKSQFTLKRKKSKSELDFGDLVCPLDPNKTGEPSHGDGITPNTTPKLGGVFHENETNETESFALSKDNTTSYNENFCSQVLAHD